MLDEARDSSGHGGLSFTELLTRLGESGGVSLDESSTGRAGGADQTEVLSSVRALSGRYSLGGVVAQGGMGAVLDARDLNVRRQVAMKVILKQESATNAQVLRFIEEAQITGQLEHPGIVPVHELGVAADGRVYYTMKMVRGTTLHEVLARLADGDPDAIATYPLNALLSLLLRVCDAVAFAHSKRVIHRDLKPRNVMVGDFGEVLVMDWGLAKVLGRDPSQGEVRRGPGQSAGEGGANILVCGARGPERGTRNAARGAVDISEAGARGVAAARPGGFDGGDAADSRGAGPAAASARIDAGLDAGLTLDGQVLGTLAFMAPEQALGKVQELDARTDVYALGAILYNILALRPPIEGETRQQVHARVCQGLITPPVALRGQSSDIGGRGRKRDPGVQVSGVRCQVEAETGTRGLTPGSSFPHCPGGRIPAALSAVAMKALAQDPAARYPSVLDFQREIAAYQAGFATAAERAGLGRQLVLLVKRHRTVFAVAAAAVLLLGLVVAAAVVRLSVEKDRAVAARDQAQTEKAHAEQQKTIAETARSAEALARQEATVRTHELSLAMAAEAIQAHDSAAYGLLAGLERTWEVGFLLREARRVIWPVEREVRLPAEILGGNQDGSVLVVRERSMGAELRDILMQAELGRLRVWSTERDAMLGTIPCSLGGRVSVLVASVSADGSRAAVVVHDLEKQVSSLVLSAVADGADPLIISTGGGVHALCFTPDGSALAAIVARREVRIWRVADGAELLVLKGHAKAVAAHAASPDGTLLASGGRDGIVKLWSLPAGTECGALPAGNPVSAVRFSPDGKSLAVATEDGEVTLWSTLEKTERWHAGSRGRRVGDLQFSPDGRFLVASGLNDTIFALSAEDGTRLLTLHTSWTTNLLPHVFFSKDSRFLRLTESSMEDNTGVARSVGKVWTFRIGAAECRAVLTGGGRGGWEQAQLSFSPDGARLVAPGANEAAKVWQVADGAVVLTVGSGKHSSYATLSPDGKLIATVHPKGEGIRLWSADDGHELRGLAGSQSRATESLAFDPDSARIAAAALGERDVLIWSVRDGAVIRSVTTIPDELAGLGLGSGNRVCFSADGRVLADFIQGVSLWSVADGASRLVIPGWTCPWLGTFSPDGRSVVTGLYVPRPLIKAWSVQDGTECVRLEGHSGSIRSISFSPDGARLASVGGPGEVFLWDVARGRRLPLDKAIAIPDAQTAAFDPTGRYLAVACSDGRIELLGSDYPAAPGSKRIEPRH